MADQPGLDEPGGGLPSTLVAGTRWLATATAAVLIASTSAALRGPAGPRPVPLVLVGVVLSLHGFELERRGRRGNVSTTLVIVGSLVLLLGAQAWLTPTAGAVQPFLIVAGTVFVLLGLLRNDRRPVVVGLLQWASAIARPTGETFRHCLVATDVAVPLPQVDGLIVLGLVALAASVTMRTREWRVDAGRGFAGAGLALLLGALAAKALELPGHRALCGTGDAIDAGWALLLLASAAAISWLGLRWHDRLWAASGLAAATLFALAAITLEANPLWGVPVGLPLAALLVHVDRHCAPWPRGANAPLPSEESP